MTESKTEKTIAAYNINAQKYSSKFEDFPAYKEKITSFTKAYIAKGARILDLGCGPGNNITTIRHLDPTCHFTGVDLSEKLLDIATKKHPDCTFYQQDIRQLQAETSFDVVIASFCIVHLHQRETEDVIAKISECLTEGGSLYLSFMEGEVAGFESTSFSSEKIFFNYYAVADVITMLEKYDIIPQEVQREPYVEQDGSETPDVFIFAVKKKTLNRRMNYPGKY